MLHLRTRRAVLRAKPVALAVSAAFLPWNAAHALPTGEHGIVGDVTVSRPTTQTMQINQGTQKGIVNWQGFSIGAREHVNVAQPNASAALLNRVVGNSPSEIFGRLTANGQVFLVNNAGVLFAPGASVEVGSMLAATLSITDQNFLNGTYQFYNPGNAGSVVNQGSIVTAGGYTALIGPQVRNDGVIIANSGKVALAAGNAVSLAVGDGLISVVVDEAAFNASVVNTGTLQADGGTVLLKASSMNALLDTVINTSGVVRANALVARNGEIHLDGGNAGVVAVSGTLQATSGTIAIHGDKVGILDAARIDASGDAGGGTISTHASALYVGPQASIDADALHTGDGGRIVLWSRDSTKIHGSVSARGAAGGFVETSGAYLEISRTPEVGHGGTWLIDPYNIVVVAGAGTVNNDGGPSFTPNGDESQIGATLISSQLDAGGNVVLDTGGVASPGTQAGDITVNAAISKTAANAASLTLNAANDVNINATIEMAAGDFNVTAGGDMLVRSLVDTRAGSMSVTLGGALSVVGAGTQDGILRSSGGQTITAQSVTVTANDGRRGVIENNGSGEQTMNTGALTLSGGSVRTSDNQNLSGVVQNGADAQTVNASSVQVIGTDAGANNGIFIRAATGNQTLNVAGGDITIKAGAGGEAWIQGSPTGLQTIYARNITMQNAGADPTDPANAGIDSFAALQGGHQEIHATGDVLLKAGRTSGSGGGVRLGGLRNPVDVTATDLTLTVDGDLVLQGGTGAENGVSIGTSGQSALPNSIDIKARNVVLNAGTGVGASARIGSGSNALAGGTIVIDAEQGIELNGTTESAAIRTLGSVTLDAASITERNNGFVRADTLTTITSGNTTLTGPNQINRFHGTSGGALTLVDAGSLEVLGITTTNDPITLTTDTLINSGDIDNGGGANALVILNANAFNLAGGDVHAGAAAVAVRPRTSTNLFRIESGPALLGQTSLSNADIAKIHTSNFLILGSGQGAFTGNMTIGQNAQVDGGNKNLAFFKTGPGTITIGAQGVTTSGDVIVSSNGGSITSVINGGRVSADEVQLRATQGVGASAARVNTNANALTVGTAGSAFVAEANDLTLRTIALNVNGEVAQNTTNTTTGGMFDLIVGGSLDVRGPVTSFGSMSINAAGALTVNNAVLSATGGQSIVAQSVNVQAQNGGLAQILNNAFGTQGITAGTVDVQTLNGGGTAEIRNNSFGQQTLTVTGDHLNVHGQGAGSAVIFASGNQTIDMTSAGPKSITLGSEAALGGSSIRSGGMQLITGDADIAITGGSSPIDGASNAFIVAFNPGATQWIDAGTITLANSNNMVSHNSVAAILGASQLINTTGDVTLTANKSGGDFPGVRIGGLGGGGSPATTTQLSLNVGQDLILSGGTAANNGVGIGSTVSLTAPPLDNNITINARNVVLNSGTGEGAAARIGSPEPAPGFMPGAGDITIVASEAILLNGENQAASIRTRDSVTLNAANISESGNGFIVANALTLNSTGDVDLAGANRVSSLSAPPVPQTLPEAPRAGVGGKLTFNNTDALAVNGTVESGGAMTLTVAGALNVTGAGVQDAILRSNGGQTITAQSVNVSAQNGRAAQIVNNGAEQIVTASSIDVQTQAGGGTAEIRNNAGGEQVITVTGDHLNVQALGGGFATVTSGGNQSIAMTSPGARRITLGGDSALGSSSIFSGGDQTIDGNADLFLTGSGRGIVGPGGNARIDTAAGRSQTIHAGSIVLANSSNANSSTFSGLTSSHQAITATGDVIMTAGQGAHPGAVRIQGSGATDLNLNIGRSLLISGGNAPGAGIGLGSSNVSNNIVVQATGDVIVNSGMNGARIGSSSDGTVGGNISISARSIQLNGTGASAAIRTLDSVTLSATQPGGTISESGNGFIVADTLTTTTTGSTTLTGPNHIDAFKATSGGNVSLNNNVPLDVTGLIAAGDANISNHGDVTVSGLWDVDGTSTITVASDIVIRDAMISPTVVLSATDGAIREEGDGSIAASTLTTFSLTETNLGGANNVEVLNSTSTGGLTFNNTAASFTLGEIETNGGAFSLVQTGDMTVTNAQAFREVKWAVAGSLALLGGSAPGSAAQIESQGPVCISVGGDLRLAGGSGDGAFARILGYSSINLTLGGSVRLDRGTGRDAFARIQLASRDNVIALNFLTTSGGYFVNGIESLLRDGHTGFLADNGVAAPDQQLVINYAAQ